MKKTVKKYFIAGILILVPIWITFSILEYLITAFDGIIALLPPKYQLDNLIGFHIPGLAFLVVMLVIFFTGMLTTNFVGKYLVNAWELLLTRIPLVRSIYISVKQILNTMFISSEKSFRKVVLIEYPRKKSWTLAFVTNIGLPAASQYLEEEEMVTVFVPTTPNPISGFLLFIPRKETIELDINIDDALKLIISMGVIFPKAE